MGSEGPSGPLGDGPFSCNPISKDVGGLEQLHLGLILSEELGSAPRIPPLYWFKVLFVKSLLSDTLICVHKKQKYRTFTQETKLPSRQFNNLL